MEEARNNILLSKKLPYCVTYEMLKLLNDLKKRKAQMTRIFTLFILENIQMMFSNETINKIREKKRMFPLQNNDQDNMSKMSTTISIADAITNADMETAEITNHWFFGIQKRIYPYHLLTTILGCLKEMNFVSLLIR